MSFDDNDLGELGRGEETRTPTSGLSIANSDAEQSAFSDRLKFLVEKEGSLAGFARKAGVSPRQLDKYLKRGADPSRERLVGMAEAAGVSVDWLASGRAPMILHLSDLHFSEPAPQGEAAGYLRVPRYDVRAAAGSGTVVESERVLHHVLFDPDYLRSTLRLNPQRLVLIEASGDSMAPTIHSGDLLLVDTSPPKLRGDGIYVIRVDDVLLVKRVSVRLDGGIVLKSDNPSYETRELAKRDLDQVEIVGRVVWTGGPV